MSLWGGLAAGQPLRSICSLRPATWLRALPAKVGIVDVRAISSMLFACGICLAAGSALTWVEPDVVQLVMSGLPPQSSASYQAMRRLAAAQNVQQLTLTKAEIWRVPRGNVREVEKEAARHGVSVTPLGAHPTRILHRAPADTRFDEKQRALLEQAEASKATLGVAIMATPPPPIVEYALTRHIDSSPGAQIQVKLSNTTDLTLMRSSVQVASDVCIWRGRVEGTGAPVSLMWWPSGKLAGTIRHQGRIYSIRHMGGELHAIIQMSKNRMPPLHAPVPERIRFDSLDWRK